MLNEEEALLTVAQNLGIITPEQADKARDTKNDDSDTTMVDVLKGLGYVSSEQYKQLMEGIDRFKKDHPEVFDPDKPNDSSQFKSSDDIYAALEEQTRRGESSESIDQQLTIDVHTPASSSATVITCQKCGTKHHVVGFERGKQYNCKNCNSLLDTGTAIGEMAQQETVAFKSQDEDSSAEEADPLVGKIIGGCKIISKLGQGGMGAVYKATHLALKKTVAVKILPQEMQQKAQHDRFVREAQTAAQLEHPNVVQVHNVAAEEGQRFIVMQYVEGKTLSQIVKSGDKIELIEAVRIIRDAAKGLRAAHRKHMVHRDIKPDNIMVTDDREVKVMDFGLAKSLDTEMEITRTGQVLGTPYYMSPEQCGEGSVDHQSDIYSLGVTFYYLLTGQRPFTGDTPLSVMMKHLNEPPPDPREFQTDLDPRIVDILLKMIEKDKSNRYPSADVLIADLDAVLSQMQSGVAVPLSDSGAFGSGTRETVPATSGGGKGVLITVIVLILLGGGAAGAYFGYFKDKLGGGSATGTAITRKTGAATSAGTSSPATTTATVPSGPSEAELLAKEAENSLVQVKDQALPLLAAGRYDEALNKYQAYPDKYKKTPSWSEYVDLKGDVFNKAAEAYDNARKEADQLAMQDNMYDAAVARIKPFQGVEVAGIGEKASVKIEEYRKQKDEYLKEQEFEEKKKAEQIKLAEANGLFDKKEYTAASALYTELLKSSSAEIKAKADAKLKRIQSLQKESAEDYEFTMNKVNRLLADSMFDEAVRMLRSYIDREDRIPDNRKKAEARLEEIRLALRKHWADKKESARKLKMDGRYEEARETYRPFQNSVDMEIAEEAKKLTRGLEVWTRYEAALRKSREFEKKGEYDNAIREIGKFADSEEKEIAGKVSGRIAKLRETLIAKCKKENPDMILVEGGTYTVGSKDETDGNPEREVKLTAFLIDKHEVTNKQYEAFVKATGHEAPKSWINNLVPTGKENHPVAEVSYEDAAAYASWAGKRLPTAEEWEVAAGYDPSGKKRLKFPWGNTYAAGKANVNSRGSQPVCSKPEGASPAGCMDMAGNVWEWTASLPEGRSGSRIIKGGGFNDPTFTGLNVRFNLPMRSRTKKNYIGFRCVKDIE